MIDLSRYDGHTPGPWELDPNDPYEIEDGSGHTSDACDVGWANQEKENWDDEYDGDPLANARLMCDAPLLLEEVRRLEAECRELREAVEAHRRDLWEPGPVDHYADRKLYAVLEEVTHE